jgi:aspartate kinase
VQATHEGTSNDIAFTLPEGDADRAELVCREVLASLGADGAQLSAQGGMAKLSISGAGIMGRPGVAARLFDTLARAGINLRLIATSEVKVSCLVAGDQGQRALRAAAEAFELAENQLQLNPALCRQGDPAVRGVALDRDQAQVAVRRVPDRPGTAAAVCRALADAGISLDAIVQSERTHGGGTEGGQLSRDMSFTLKRDDRTRAEQALAHLLQQWPGSHFEEGPAIARVSAVGAGMPCTAGTAARMFRCLADAGINIELIATSEIRTSCVVAEADGVRALQAVHTAFGLGGSVVHKAEGTEAPV